MTNRAVLYLRSSKDRSDISIDAQRRALHELSGTRGLVVVDEFVDAVESGKDADRPGFQRLLIALKEPARAWDCVIVLDTSRVARNRMIAQIFERECAKRKARLIYRSVPDTDPVTEMLLKAILQAMDEWHSLTSKQKGLAGMAENVRQGWRAGGRAPRGYKLAYQVTGAIREGAPVTKSRLEMDDENAPRVTAYLQLRAQGISRGTAIARLQLPWNAASLHSMDWQALTYAGHTVWNMHAENGDGEKRRPRADWVIKRNTHPAMITDDDAEAILAQQARSLQGRRMRASPLLLTGLLTAPDGTRWHSNGNGLYRLGKGKAIAAERLDSAVLKRIGEDLQGDESIERVLKAIRALDEPRVDGRVLASLERRICSLTLQIGRTVDLASQIDDPAPVLRRVTELEDQRAAIMDDLAAKRATNERAVAGEQITADQVRALLRRLFTEIATSKDMREQSRLALNEIVEKIELEPDSLNCRVHYAISTSYAESGRDNLASPRGFEPLYSP